MLEQHLAGLGQRDAAAALRPLHQPVADPSLEDRDLLADRRLGEPEMGRGRPERALAGDRPQRCEVAQLDAGPRAKCSNLPRVGVARAGAQPPFCFPPTWDCAISNEPATIRG